MTPLEILVYVGGAAGYAVVGTVLVLGARALWRWRASGRVVPPGPALAGLVCSTLFVIFLGLHPFPDPATLDCTAGGTRMLLQPFGFVEPYQRFWREGRPLQDWLQSLGIIAPVMNVVFFAGVGLFLRGVTGRPGLALLYGIGLTGFIELSQATALYGVYPCPYRHFEIDDLMLNVLGVMLGWAVAGGLRGGGDGMGNAAPSARRGIFRGR